jgi:hypothetical protein
MRERHRPLGRRRTQAYGQRGIVQHAAHRGREGGRIPDRHQQAGGTGAASAIGTRLAVITGPALIIGPG